MTATIAALGDSQTDYASFGVRPTDNWSHKVGMNLRARGADVRTRNFSIYGQDSADILARCDAALMYDTAGVVLLPIGVNDPGASIDAAHTTLNLQATIRALKHGVTGRAVGAGSGNFVAGQDNLPSYGAAGQRIVVLADTSTTGGLAARVTGQAATITGSVALDANDNQVTVWEWRQNLAGELGWGRVATADTAATAVARFAVVAPPYRNWSTGGDTPATPWSVNATFRAAQQAAVSAENQTVDGAPTVIYIDAYAYMLARIVAGTDPNFSADTSVVAHTDYDQTRSFHWEDGDQHLCLYGHDVYHQAVIAALDDQAPAWLADLGVSS